MIRFVRLSLIVIFGFAVFAGGCTAEGPQDADDDDTTEEQYYNDGIQQAVSAGEISFAEADYAGLSDLQQQRVRLGHALFTVADREAFMAQAADILPDAPETEVAAFGWVALPDQRYVGPAATFMLSEIDAMPDEDFATWRSSWTRVSARDRQRLTPRGQDEGDTRYEVSRIIVLAQDQQEFAEQIAPHQDGGGDLTMAYIQNCNTTTDDPFDYPGPHMYALSGNDILALSEDDFLIWRSRFVYWIRLHAPGQSDVHGMVSYPQDQFHAAVCAARDNMLSYMLLDEALSLFTQNYGIEIMTPDITDPDGLSPIIGSVTADSAADRAGLQEGDVVLSVEGEPTAEWDEFISLISTYQAGSQISVVVTRAQEDEPVELLYDAE